MLPTHARSLRSILLAGATGLVGRECLALLLDDPAFDRVVTVTRRPLLPHHLSSKLEAHVVDFDADDLRPLLAVDAIICALGTTMRSAGSEAAFRRVDFDYPLALARLGLEQGASHFLLVSALGANPRSRVFYNRVKGELEQRILALPFRAITIVRPSLLLGERAEFRLGEEVAKRFAFVLPRRYAPVPARAVATVLVNAARENAPGHRIIESSEIVVLAPPE